MRKLLLIDGNNLLFRSYYATAAMGNLMQNSMGVYTNGVFGFVSTIQSLLNRDFTHILVAFDCKGKTFRHERFPEYKGTRKETPQELIMQMPLVREYLDAAGVPRYEQDQYEADDIIGYCATALSGDFDAIEIFSNDHDLLQLLSPKVTQIISKKGLSEVEIFTPQSMREKLGFGPEQMPDYKGLVGDPSDNIPGVPGIGDKTAVKLLSEYGTLENILLHSDDLKGKLREKIVTYQEQARFSKEMATIIRDFSNEIRSESLVFQGSNPDTLRAFLQKMEFRAILRSLELGRPKPSSSEDPGFQTVTSEEMLRSILEGPASLHLELFGLNYHTAQKLGFGLVNAKGRFFIDYRWVHESARLREWLKDPTAPKDVFDFKQMKVALLWDGVELRGVRFDLLLAAYLLNPNETQTDFRGIATIYHVDSVSFDEEVYGRGAKYALPEDFESVKNHAVRKAAAISELKPLLLTKIEEYGQTRLLNEVEIPLADTLAQMEYSGISLDENALDEFGNGLGHRIQELEAKIYEAAGEEFNVNSPKQLGVILFEKLNLPYYKKSKEGYSTDVKVLEQITGFHPIVEMIMEHRTVKKLYSTYYEGLKTALTMKKDGKVHTIYRQTVAQTGRLSSIEPNLQNIPVRTEEGKEIRRIFIAEPDSCLYSCDYSQIELRVLAEMAEVEPLIEAFRRGEDIHTHTAKLIFGKTDISPEERRVAKAVNFGIIYGKTAWGLSEDLKISPKQAESFINHYFAQFPGIKAFMNRQIEEAKTQGYVRTILNRRRYIPEVSADNYMTREFGKRMAMNAPIQGSAADILKVAMVRIAAEIARRGLKTQILLQIHDELVFSVPNDEKTIIESLVREQMEHAVPFRVPLTIAGSFGQNLFEVA
jgi:DNA polymerase-1